MTTRVEQIGDATLHLGDCLEVMPTLNVVDHVICDPPYEAHMHEAKRGEKTYGSARRIRIDGHANPPAVEFGSIVGVREAAAREMVRVSNGWALVFCTPEGVAAWRDAVEGEGAKYKRACIWVKPDSAPQFNGQGPAMGAEMFVTAWCGPGYARWNGGGRRNVFTHLCQPSDRNGEHPTEKPVSLMREIVDLFSSAGEIVLDPFMGSGTTGIACMKLGRPFIGIEKDPKWFDLACRRIDEASRQRDIFRDVAPVKPVQLKLGDAA